MRYVGTYFRPAVVMTVRHSQHIALYLWFIVICLQTLRSGTRHCADRSDNYSFYNLLSTKVRVPARGWLSHFRKNAPNRRKVRCAFIRILRYGSTSCAGRNQIAATCAEVLPMKLRKHIAIVGAGPIGLEAALAAMAHGHRVSVFERGEAGDAVRRWGHVRMFSPFGMNVSLRGIERLKKRGHALPDPDAILTGTEFVAQYLAPLADTLGEEIVHTN